MRTQTTRAGRPRALCTAMVAALLTAPLATAAAADEDDEPASVAQTCLPHRSIDRTKILDDQNILFITHAGQAYHNQLPRACASVRRNSLLNYAIENRELCAGTSFAVLLEISTTRIPTQVCRLGMFRPISEDEVLDLIALTEEEPRRRRAARRHSERAVIQTEAVELPRNDAPAPAATPQPPAP